jgi:uroporphyrinogen III methyltransferase/synthase
VERVSHTIEPVASPEPVGEADLAIFTSRVAVAHALGATAAVSLPGAIRGVRVAAVGVSTAEALRELGIETDLVAGGSADALLALLPARLDGRRVLWPCGEDAGDRLATELARRGAKVERRVVYRKIPAPRDAALSREVVERPFTAFAATSPAAFAWLWEGLGEEGRARLRETAAVALGPSTRAALSDRGISRIETTAEASLPELLKMLAALAAGAAPK